MNEDLIAAAELGDEAMKFKESDLYRCMVGIAQQEADIAKELLVDVDPADHEKIRKIQNEVRVALHFEQWLNELIDKGNAALEVYKHEQEK